MKSFRRLVCIIGALALLATMTACHKKDEVAFKYGDVTFTSAYYMCALMEADSEGRTKVDEQLEESESSEESTTEDSSAEETTEDSAEETTEDSTEESTEETTSSETDYFAQKIDDKDYSTWVKDEAIEILKERAYYISKCKEAELELDESTASYIEQYASYYWSSYGYSTYYEPNGVGEATYTQYMKDSYYEELYFEHLYVDDDAEQKVSDEDIKNTAGENYVLANTLSGSLTDSDGNELDESSAAALKSTLESYVTALNDGSKTFEDVYHEYNGTDASEDSTSTTNDDDETITAVNQHATVMGDEESNYSDDNYETVKALKVGEYKLVTSDSEYTIVGRVELLEDQYYLDQIETSVIHDIKDEEFDIGVQTALKDLDYEVVAYAVNRFKVKKIEYPSYES